MEVLWNLREVVNWFTFKNFRPKENLKHKVVNLKHNNPITTTRVINKRRVRYKINSESVQLTFIHSSNFF